MVATSRKAIRKLSPSVLDAARKCRISPDRARIMINAATRERQDVRCHENIPTGGCSFTSEILVFDSEYEWEKDGWQIDDGVVRLEDGTLYEHVWIFNRRTKCIFDPTQDQFAYYKAPGPPEHFFLPKGSPWWKRYHGWRSGPADAEKYVDDDTGDLKGRAWNPKEE